MAQYANPHMQQPHQPYGQPQPQPPYQQRQSIPMWSYFPGGDGRTVYQMTPQGPVLAPVAPQQQGYGQPPMQQPFVQQAPMYPPGYMPNPLHQQGNTQLPVYGGQAPMNQPTVYPNPQPGAQSNRFGGKEQTPPVAAAPTPQPQQPITEPPMQLVSQQPNLNKKKMSIESTSFTPAQRIKPFNGEVVYCSTVIITDCLDAMVEDAIEKTVAMDNSPSVVFFEGVMSMVFHKANKERYAADLLQPDIRAIYKAFKVHLNTINNRYDYAYVNAINEFLTTTINDIMRPFKNNLNVFENFSTDFNDMLTVMRNKDSIETEDKLIGYVNEILVKTNLNQQISDSFEEEEAAEAQKNGETHTPLKRATIDVPVNIICLNYISTEIGDADNLKHLLQNIEQLAASVNHGFHAAYVCTIDKVIYKIVVGGGNIFVDLVRG